MSLPLQGAEYTFYFELVDLINPDNFLIDPTIVAGDFKLSIDGAALVNFTNLPQVTPPGSSWVKAILTAAEMTGENVNWQGKDQSDDEWQDVGEAINVPIGTVETVLDIQQGDRIETNVNLTINKRGTMIPVLEKTIIGSLLSPSVTLRTLDP